MSLDGFHGVKVTHGALLVCADQSSREFVVAINKRFLASGGTRSIIADGGDLDANHLFVHQELVQYCQNSLVVMMDPARGARRLEPKDALAAAMADEGSSSDG